MTPADRAQIELLRRATPERRMALAFRLSMDTIKKARRAIAEAHPELGEWEQRVKFVEVHHGRELAMKYRRHLVARGLIRERA